jgi:hypothetical protein
MRAIEGLQNAGGLEGLERTKEREGWENNNTTSIVESQSWNLNKGCMSLIEFVAKEIIGDDGSLF